MAHTPIRINIRTIIVWLLAISGLLTVFSLIANAYVLEGDRAVGLAAQRIVDFVDLDAEANAPTFFSILLLATAACLLYVIARHRSANDEPYASHWALLSLLFLGLSFDEAVSIHETMIGPFRRMFPDYRFAYFGWVIPGAAFVVLVGAWFLGFLMKLDQRTRNLFVIAGVIFVGGALGLEVVEGYIASARGEENWTYEAALTAQELLEMVGVIVFIYALLDYLQGLSSGLDFSWADDDAAQHAA